MVMTEAIMAVITEAIMERVVRTKERLSSEEKTVGIIGQTE